MPFAAQATEPVEDISAVLGRFEAWAGKPAKPGTGVREISYEEAVQSSRYRRADRTPLPPLQIKPTSEAKGKASLAPAEEAKAKAGVKAASVKIPPQNPAKASRPAKGAGRAQKSRREKRPATAQKSVEAQPQFRQILESSVAAEAVSTLGSPAPLQPKPAALGKVGAQTRSIDAARQVMLSVRLSGAEQALIRTRAQEANVSVSAYMRQCALEVEQLRDQVERTLAAMQRGAPQQSSAASPYTPGFFARIARKLFGGSTDSTLAMRA